MHTEPLSPQGPNHHQDAQATSGVHAQWISDLEDLASRLDDSSSAADAARLRHIAKGLASLSPANHTSRRIPASQEPDTQAELHRRLAARREQERQELARSLNDGPMQRMVNLLSNLQLAREAVEDGNVSLMLEPMIASLKDTVQELREVVNDLRPPTVIRFGLSRAIQLHSEDIRARYQQLRMDLDLVEDENLLPEETCLALYRIYQEGVTNVLRHAGARNLWVRYYPLRSVMVLEIWDNGRGFQVPEDWVELTRQGRFGLAGMQERAAAIGGAVAITSEMGKGTRLEARVPIPRPA
jgi:signal transduction histidine kinase